MQVAVLASGSSGNSVFIQAGETRLLIDIGVSNRYICQQLEGLTIDPASIDAVLITHEHTDHVSGIPVFAKRHPVRIFANEGTWGSGKKCLERVNSDQKAYFTTHQKFSVGQVEITPFAISHDAVDPVGYKIEYAGQKAVVATDLGIISQGVYEHLAGTDALVVEANHDREMLRLGPYPAFLKRRIAGKKGHLPNDITAKLLQKIITRRTKAVFLAHLSDTNNSPRVAYDTVSRALDATIFKNNVELIVSKRKMATALVSIAD